MEQKSVKTTKKLPVRLTTEETNDRAHYMAKTIEEVASLKEEKKTLTKDITGKISIRNEMIRKLSRAIASGEETRDVECDVTKDFATKTITVTRCDTGEVVEERPMTPEELQETMFATTPPEEPKKARTSKWKFGEDLD